MAAASRFQLWGNCSISTGLMILGESPYRDRPLTPEFTTHVVQDAMRGSGDPSLNFFAKTVGSFFGGRQNIECRRDFLRTVAFYNFIQDSLPGSKARPSREVWTRAIPAFTEVLQKLEPQLVLVLARDLWNQISTIPIYQRFRWQNLDRSILRIAFTYLEFLLPDQSPKQRWLELQELVSLRESRNPKSHQCFFDRDTQDRKHMVGKRCFGSATQGHGI